jgi:hypothetical protein
VRDSDWHWCAQLRADMAGMRATSRAPRVVRVSPLS